MELIRVENLSLYERQILKHFVQFWGEPRDIYQSSQPIASPPYPVYIAEFDLGDGSDPYWAYATIGMSRNAMPGMPDKTPSENERQCELFIYSGSNKFQADLTELLTILADYPFRHKTFFYSGHRVAGTEGQGVVKNSPLTEIFLLYPYNEPREFSAAHDNMNRHVDILWVTPIYKSERLYAAQAGWEKLVERFEANEIDSADFERLPVI